MNTYPTQYLFWNMDLSFLSQMPPPAPSVIHSVCHTAVYESKGLIYDRKRCNSGEMTMDPPVLLQSLPPSRNMLCALLKAVMLPAWGQDPVESVPYLQNGLR